MEESEPPAYDDLPEVTTPRGGSTRRGRGGSLKRAQPPIPPPPVREEEPEEEQEEEAEEEQEVKEDFPLYCHLVVFVCAVHACCLSSPFYCRYWMFSFVDL